MTTTLPPPETSFTRQEMMVVAASRMLNDNDVCLVGIGAPSVACNLARLTHAPRIKLIYESGTLDTKPRVLPLSIGDGELCETALTTVSLPEIFRYWLQGGRITVGFLGGAQVDKFANLNTSVIGDYHKPKVRLPGAGGAPEIATGCDRVFIIMEMSPRRFVNKLSFVTTLGHGHGGNHRQELGVHTAGPVALITDLCILEPEPITKEMIVTTIHEGITREEVSAACGWSLRFAENVDQTLPPTEGELEALRDLQERTRRAHAGED